jgi:Domain of unknown function (DUF4134)
MLHAIPWSHFVKWITFLMLLYYLVVILLFFPKEIINLLRRRKKTALLVIGLTGCLLSQAQDGNQGINQANNMVRGYYETGTQLLYGVGGVLALIGAIRVYKLWNEEEGHGTAYKAATGWFGACIFLVVVTSVIRSFFGL